MDTLRGILCSRVTNDVDTAAQSLNQSLGTVLSSSLFGLSSLGNHVWDELDFSLGDYRWCSLGFKWTHQYRDYRCLYGLRSYLFSASFTNAQGITSLQQASAAMGRVFEFLAEEEMEDESHKERQLSDMKGQVVFDRVSFGYTPERTIIHDFSATAHAGQKVAIVGPTGAGKTTIVNLLMKFYEIDKGSIRIDGVDSKEMKRSEVHDAFSMVLQDTWLFGRYYPR